MINFQTFQRKKLKEKNPNLTKFKFFEVNKR